MEERGLGVGVVLGGGWVAGGGALTCTILVLPPEIVLFTAVDEKYYNMTTYQAINFI